MVVVGVIATDAFLPRVCLQHQNAAAPRDLQIPHHGKLGRLTSGTAHSSYIEIQCRLISGLATSAVPLVL